MKAVLQVLLMTALAFELTIAQSNTSTTTAAVTAMTATPAPQTTISLMLKISGSRWSELVSNATTYETLRISFQVLLSNQFGGRMVRVLSLKPGSLLVDYLLFTDSSPAIISTAALLAVQSPVWLSSVTDMYASITGDNQPLLVLSSTIQQQDTANKKEECSDGCVALVIVAVVFLVSVLLVGATCWLLRRKQIDSFNEPQEMKPPTSSV